MPTSKLLLLLLLLLLHLLPDHAATEISEEEKSSEGNRSWKVHCTHYFSLPLEQKKVYLCGALYLGLVVVCLLK